MLSRILPLLVTLSLVTVPQISFAQTVQDLIEQADTAGENDNYQEAEALLRRVLQKNLQNAEAYAKLGDALFFQGKTEAGLAAYRQSLKLQPSAEFYTHYGNKLFAVDKSVEAIAAFRQALKLDSKSDSAYNGMGSALVDLRKYPEAIASFQQAVKLNPSAENYESLGYGFRMADRNKEAAAAYRQAIKLDRKRAWSYISLADILPLAQAVATFRQFSKLDPDNSVPFDALGYVYQRNDKLDEAVTAYRQAIKINPNASSYESLGDVLMQQEKLELASNAYRQAIAIEPGDFNYSRLAESLLKQRKPNEAQALCHKVIELELGAFYTCSTVGFALYKEKGYAAVKNFYHNLAANLKPDEMAGLYVRLGNDIQWEADGDKKAAFQEALKFNPNDKYALQGLEELKQDSK